MGIEITNGKRYITYLPKDEEFDPELFHITLSSSTMFKPRSAWWGSPEDSEWGWKEWCENEDFGEYDFDKPIKWHLKEDSKVFEIHMKEVTNFSTDNPIFQYLGVRIHDKDITDIQEKIRLIKIKSNGFDISCTKEKMIEVWKEAATLEIRLDFVKMHEDGISAVELFQDENYIGHMFLNELELHFNSWDCESIVVLNRDAIVFE